jgi:hypothetical protein
MRFAIVLMKTWISTFQVRLQDGRQVKTQPNEPLTWGKQNNIVGHAVAGNSYMLNITD